MYFPKLQYKLQDLCFQHTGAPPYFAFLCVKIQFKRLIENDKAEAAELYENYASPTQTAWIFPVNQYQGPSTHS